MKGKRRKFSAEFKAKLALESLKEGRGINELASRHEVHPNQIGQWKKQLVERAGELFADARTKSGAGQDRTAQLYQEIGRLQFELEWLKKKVGDEQR